MKQYAVDEILNGIRKRSDKVLHYVYHENYPTVKSFIIENRGNSQDAKDIFQEGLVIIFRKVTSGELMLD